MAFHVGPNPPKSTTARNTSSSENSRNDDELVSLGTNRSRRRNPLGKYREVPGEDGTDLTNRKASPSSASRSRLDADTEKNLVEVGKSERITKKYKEERGEDFKRLTPLMRGANLAATKQRLPKSVKKKKKIRIDQAINKLQLSAAALKDASEQKGLSNIEQARLLQLSAKCRDLARDLTSLRMSGVVNGRNEPEIEIEDVEEIVESRKEQSDEAPDSSDDSEEFLAENLNDDDDDRKGRFRPRDDDSDKGAEDNLKKLREDNQDKRRRTDNKEKEKKLKADHDDVKEHNGVFGNVKAKIKKRLDRFKKKADGPKKNAPHNGAAKPNKNQAEGPWKLVNFGENQDGDDSNTRIVNQMEESQRTINSSSSGDHSESTSDEGIEMLNSDVDTKTKTPTT
jgi:hypothetical protein